MISHWLNLVSFYVTCWLSLPWLSSSLQEDADFGGLAPFLYIGVLSLSFCTEQKETPKTMWWLRGVLMTLSLYLLQVGLIDLAALAAAWGWLVVGFRSKGHVLLMLQMMVLLLPTSGLGLPFLCREVSIALLKLLCVPLNEVWFIGKTCFVKGETLLILETCSGATLSKMLVWLALFKCWFFKGTHKTFWILMAFPMGLGLNVLRLYICVIGALFWGTGWVASMDSWIGLSLFMMAALMLLKKTPQEKLLALRWDLKTTLPLFLFWCSVVTCVGDRERRSIQHHYRDLSFSNEKVFEHHRFVEASDGQGWYLLKHPIEVCLRLKGWDLDLERFDANLKERQKKVELSYRMGECVMKNRLDVFYHLVRYPFLWKEDLVLDVYLQEG